MKLKQLLTHSGTMHADEVLALAILRYVFPDAVVIRTRESAILEGSLRDPAVAVVDIGGDYNPALNNFDHHQRAFSLVRPAKPGRLPLEVTEWPFASAGLAWQAYGLAFVQRMFPNEPANLHAELVTYADESLIRFVDAVDCGCNLRTTAGGLSSIISSFNPLWFESEDSDEAFDVAMHLAQAILVRHIMRFAAKVLARHKVRSAPTVCDGQVLKLSEGVPWAMVVTQEMPEVKLVVYPSSPGWKVQCAADPGTLSPRIRMPEPWGGLDGAMLQATSGVTDAIFCHRSRHLAGALTEQGAMALAVLALENHQAIKMAA